LGADNFVAAGALDLVYADPPFFTNREFAGAHRNGSGTKLTFADRWLGPEGRNLYLSWLEERVRRFRPLLSPTGVFLLHLDWHVVHYAKVMCDAIFGEDRFQNELIWYYQTGGASKDRFSRKHDTILLYSNGPTFPFDGKAIAIPRTAKAMKRAQCATGARIKATDTHKNPDDVLVVPALNPMAIERTGYPTQKPVELLERLIRALTPAGGTVGDFFCGSGTTLVAAKKLGRRFVGCDINPAAVEIARGRLAAI
jgi:DNA modification methylase